MPKVEIPADQVFPVLKENILVDGFHVVIDLEKSHGAVIVDALEGKDYLDCYGFLLRSRWATIIPCWGMRGSESPS
jgi:L-lysine 6-transaminase